MFRIDHICNHYLKNGLYSLTIFVFLYFTQGKQIENSVLPEVQYNLYKNAIYLQGQQLCSLEGPIMYWLPGILFHLSISFFFLSSLKAQMM